MATTSQTDTKTAILDAAELMMAEHGIKGVSLRAILSKAGANSAALHYHFGSRDAVIEALLKRKGREPNLRRREMLDALEARGGPLTVSDAIDLIVDPMVEMLRDDGESSRRFLRFIARLQSDRAGIHQEEERKHFPDNWERMERLLHEACPHVDASELKQRVTLVIDTMLISLATAEFMTEEWSDDHAVALSKFVVTLKSFLSGGLAAPMGAQAIQGEMI